MKIKEVFRENYKRILKAVFVIAVVIIVAIGGINEFKSMEINRIPEILSRFSPGMLLLLGLFGLLSVFSMSLYDIVISGFLGIDISKKELLPLTFVANAANNISGLGGVTGASVRAYLYRDNPSFKENIKDYYIFLFSSTGVGLSVILIFSTPYLLKLKPFFLEHKIFLLAVLAYIVYFVLYFFIEQIYNLIFRANPVEVSKARYIAKIKLMLISVLEWLMAFALLYFITKVSYKEVKLFYMLVAFSIAQVIGIFSMLPGAIGSFDLAIILVLDFFGVPSEPVLTSLIIYRMFYYILPLIISAIGGLVTQIKKNKNSRIITAVSSFFTRTSSISNLILALLVYAVGALSLILGLLPAIRDFRPGFVGIVPLYIRNFSSHVMITMGILLVFIAREIRMKVKRSYKIALVLLILNIVFSTVGTFSISNLIYSIFVFVVLIMAKNSFYRRSIPTDWVGTSIKMLLTFLGLYVYMRFENIIWKHSLHFSIKEFFANEHGFVLLKTLMIYSVVALFIIYYEKTKDNITEDSRCAKFEKERIDEFLSSNKGNLCTHLVFLRDKFIFWYDDDVMFQFAFSHDYAVTLGDPIGDAAKLEEAYLAYSEFIDEYGYKLLFYHASEDFMPFYHDHGYYFFKLGEMALVSLEEFDITSPKSRDFRNNLSRFKKDGYIFEFSKGSKLTQESIAELKAVSDSWLDGRDEMGFSLGFFDEFYLSNSDIGIIRSEKTGKPVSFATVGSSYNGESVSLDLMRHSQEAPKNAMTFLILNLLLHYKKEGYKIFNMDMAPLSNVGTNPTSHFDEKLAHILYKHGSAIYSFSGLRDYKNKFKPNWVNSYLTYKNQSNLPKAWLEVSTLSHNKTR